MTTVPSKKRLAYLLSIYPAVSHTFFLNEVTALRRLGFTIDTASINRPEQAAGASALELRERESTFYVKAITPSRGLLTLLRILLIQPNVVLRGLRAALSLDSFNAKAGIYSLFYLAESLLLGDWLRRRGHTHLHIHFGGPVATVGMLTAIAWKLSYSLMIHGPDEFYDIEKFYLRQKVENARFVLCISDYSRSQVMKVSDPSHWSKLHVVRLGVDLLTFQPPSPSDRNAPLDLLCVGRLVPAKGHLILLRAFADLRRNGHNLRLRLVGTGISHSEIKEFIAQQNLHEYVILEGALNHEATRQKLMLADIFVLASFAEGVPVALMEAMAMEIPCVSTFVAGIPELIRDGFDGLLVPPSSVTALSAALEKLIVDPALRRQLGVSARRRVAEFYNLEKNTQLLANLLEDCLS
jgi:colanic acid/amylovoran biosynthesis glycosyltransferase